MQILTTEKDSIYITLKDITSLLKVEHNKAMKVVEKLSKEPSFGWVEKIATQYQSGKGRISSVNTFKLNKKQAIAVGAKLNNSLLMMLVDKLEELETKNKAQLPQTFSEALLLASKQAKVIEDQQVKIAQKSETIKNVIHSHNTYTASQVAKDMPNPISATLLNKMLVEANVIFKQNGTYQLYSKYNGYNLTEIKETKPDQNGKTYASMRWTALGKSWIYKNWTEIKQRVSTQTLSEWELAITSKLPKVPMPKKQDINF